MDKTPSHNSCPARPAHSLRQELCDGVLSMCHLSIALTAPHSEPPASVQCAQLPSEDDLSSGIQTTIWSIGCSGCKFMRINRGSSKSIRHCNFCHEGTFKRSLAKRTGRSG